MPPATKPHSPEHFRYERKYHAIDREPAELEWLVRLHRAHFREAYAPRTVNNVYFDTPSLLTYRTHVEGAPNRSKVRIRWYGDDATGAPSAVLEKKARRGLRGTKLSVPLGVVTEPRSINHPRLVTLLKSCKADPVWVERLAGWAPAIFNQYRRRYYVSTDRRVRLTIDSRMVFRAVDGSPFVARAAYREQRLSVIELKYSMEHDEMVDRAVPLPFRLERMSKYVYGVQRLSGGRLVM